MGTGRGGKREGARGYTIQPQAAMLERVVLQGGADMSAVGLVTSALSGLS